MNFSGKRYDRILFLLHFLRLMDDIDVLHDLGIAFQQVLKRLDNRGKEKFKLLVNAYYQQESCYYLVQRCQNIQLNYD